MTDHNARQAGLTDERIREIHRRVPNHHIDFARAIEREVLAAHSADARNAATEQDFMDWYADNVPSLKYSAYDFEDVEAMLRENVRAAYFATPADAASEAGKRDAERMKGLRELCGYVENGTDTVVTIFQDDATREWCVKVGNKTFVRSYGASMVQAIDAAIQSERQQGKTNE